MYAALEREQWNQMAGQKHKHKVLPSSEKKWRLNAEKVNRSNNFVR